MKAVLCEQWGGPEQLRIAERELPDPGPGEVKLRVRAAGVNFPDVLIIQKKYQVQPALPFTPGAEAAGEVIAVGPGVADFQPGDRVICYCGTGGFAEELITPASACCRIPDKLGDIPASTLMLAYGTSWHALRDRAALKPGERLLVLGAAGGVGLAAVDIGRAMGAYVIAAASSAEKLEICRQYGADALLNYGKENLRESIARLTGKNGPDVIYDPVGGDYAEPSFRSIAWRGRYLVIGFASGPIPSLALNLPLLKGASIVGVFWGAHTKREPELHRRETEEMLAWAAEGKLRPLVSRTYALAETPRALWDMAERKVTGKIVVTP
jgi:NADPH2:quinone reductase